MANKEEIALTSHLMRRAAFGAPRGEVEELAAQGYEATVEQLLDPETQPDIDEDILFRYHPMADMIYLIEHSRLNWLYRMVNTERQLVEKMALFWHHAFATGQSKVMGPYEMHVQVEMFRKHGLGNFRELVVLLAQNPAMIYWLDNNENHKRAPNENWGRELLELFTIGVGSYTETDVYESSRAFTGWTSADRTSGIQLGPLPWRFDYRPQDHDSKAKTFLGHDGNLNGEDVVDIIVRQPACAIFVSRHLYNFFVADEPPVPTWPIEASQDPEAIQFLCDALVRADFEMKPVLRELFNSDFFKQSQYRKVKNPAEVVAGTMRLTGDMHGPDPRWGPLPEYTEFMGQDLLNPPSVEGWHTGREWINSGAFMNRVNFVADQVKDTSLPGVRDIVERIAESNGTNMTASDLVEGCLDLMGPLEVEQETLRELVEQAGSDGPISWATEGDRAAASRRVGDVLALIAGTREYQFG